MELNRGLSNQSSHDFVAFSSIKTFSIHHELIINCAWCWKELLESYVFCTEFLPDELDFSSNSGPWLKCSVIIHNFCSWTYKFLSFEFHQLFHQLIVHNASKQKYLFSPQQLRAALQPHPIEGFFKFYGRHGWYSPVLFHFFFKLMKQVSGKHSVKIIISFMVK